jgi:hypothetical protein
MKELSYLKKIKHKQSLKWISLTFCCLSLFGLLFTENISGCSTIVHYLLLLSGFTYLFTLCFPFTIKFIYIFAYWYRILFLFSFVDFCLSLLGNFKTIHLLYSNNKFMVFFRLFDIFFTIVRLTFLYFVFKKHSKISVKIMKRASNSNKNSVIKTD